MSKLVADSIEDSGGLNPVSTLALGFGVGQTLQDLTGSRAFDTVYTNTTDKPILVMIMQGWQINTNFSLEIDGIDMDGRPASNNGGLYTFIQFCAIIPVGSTYRLNRNAGSALNTVWAELR